jgi:trehalose 6-phosphate phosphatase
MPPELDAAIDAIAASPTVLVACDYDGTLAEIVEDPARAFPVRDSIVALRSLAALPDTQVAVISGRAVRDLASLSRLPHEIHLVGSHGSEFEAGFINGFDDDARALLDSLTADLKRISAATPGSQLEQKPASIALHYRSVDDARVPALTEAVLSGPARRPGVRLKQGKRVIELAVVDTDKGAALTRLRQSASADVVLFVGDDVTDEDAFAALAGPDVGVKVGAGPTAAGHRVEDPSAVARLLASVFERRRTWLEGDAAPPIERHSLLSDQRTLALVTPDARVSWLCHPRADSPAVLAEILGGPTGGVFAISPDPYRPPLEQRYVGDSLVIETRWADLRVTDYLDVAYGRSYEPPGRTDLVRVVEGTGRVTIEFAPRPDFGRSPTQLDPTDDGLIVSGSAETIRLYAPGVVWEIEDAGLNQRARALVELRAGEPLVIEMQLGGDTAGSWSASEPDRRRATIEHWDRWAAGLRLPPVAPAMVRRSALILKALCHQPTGSILAAASTSLPEVIGGVRNWDYRFCWPRDAAISASALLALGSAFEALAFLDWLTERIASLATPERLRPLYPLSGDEFTPEAVIPTLKGYLGSRPVRIGNLAEHQLQLDMFGPIVDLVRRLGQAGVVIGERYWQLVLGIVDAVCRRWPEPDHGIWEERRQRRHHVHSKVMCWLALDAGIAIAQASRRPIPPHWPAARAEIHRDVLEQGWNDRIGAFTTAYGDDDIDASVLQLALVGFLPHDDPRIRATVDAVERELRTGEIVYRYRHDDGLPGKEGGFLLCTTWLIEAMSYMGRDADARSLFERYLDLAGPTGLLAEQFDPISERALGNVPQAYSHAGLILAAVTLARLPGGRQ